MEHPNFGSEADMLSSSTFPSQSESLLRAVENLGERLGVQGKNLYWLQQHIELET